MVFLQHKTYTSVFDITYETKKDSHSVNIVPVYQDLSNNLCLKEDIRLIVPRLPAVQRDIDGKTRYVHTPMGAHEFDIHKNDAAIANFASTSLAGASNLPVAVTLINMGSDTLTRATIRWTVNNVNQNAFSWSGKLATREHEVVTIGQINVSPFTSYQLTAWVEQPNGSKDEDLSNDTARYNGYVDRYEKAKERYDALTALRREKLSKAKAIDRFIATVSKREELLTEFDNRLWLSLVDYVEVHRDGTLTFHFFDGTEKTL